WRLRFFRRCRESGVAIALRPGARGDGRVQRHGRRSCAGLACELLSVAWDLDALCQREFPTPSPADCGVWHCSSPSRDATPSSAMNPVILSLTMLVEPGQAAVEREPTPAVPIVPVVGPSTIRRIAALVATTAPVSRT